MKVKLGISTPPVQAFIPVDMVALSAEIADLKDKICAVTGEISELSQVVDNLQLVRHAVAESEKPIDALTTLDTVASVESLLGVAADKITKSAAMEGLGSAIADTFKKLLEAIKKFFQWVLSIFSKNKMTVTNSVEDAKKTAETTEAAVNKAEEKFEQVKQDSERVKEMKSNPPEKPTVPEPPPARFTTPPKPDTLLITYDPNPENKVFQAGDLTQWEAVIKKVDLLYGKARDFIHKTWVKASTTREEANAKDAAFAKEFDQIVRGTFGDALRVGTGDNGVLIGIVAINDSDKLYPKSSHGTIKTLHWDREELRKVSISFDNLRKSIIQYTNGIEQAFEIRQSDLKTYNKDVSKGFAEEDQKKLEALRAMKSDANTQYRITTSIETIAERIAKAFNYDCKVVKAAMSW